MKRKKWPFSKAFGDNPKREWIYQVEDLIRRYCESDGQLGAKVIFADSFYEVVEDFDKCTGHKRKIEQLRKVGK